MFTVKFVTFIFPPMESGTDIGLFAKVMLDGVWAKVSPVTRSKRITNTIIARRPTFYLRIAGIVIAMSLSVESAGDGKISSNMSPWAKFTAPVNEIVQTLFPVVQVRVPTGVDTPAETLFNATTAVPVATVRAVHCAVGRFTDILTTRGRAKRITAAAGGIPGIKDPSGYSVLYCAQADVANNVANDVAKPQVANTIATPSQRPIQSRPM
jgi:hypothetical protein